MEEQIAERIIEKRRWRCQCCERRGHVGYRIADGSNLCPICAELIKEDSEELPPIAGLELGEWE